jgi:hypothetical protein
MMDEQNEDEKTVTLHMPRRCAVSLGRLLFVFGEEVEQDGLTAADQANLNESWGVLEPALDDLVPGWTDDIVTEEDYA